MIYSPTLLYKKRKHSLEAYLNQSSWFGGFTGVSAQSLLTTTSDLSVICTQINPSPLSAQEADVQHTTARSHPPPPLYGAFFLVKPLQT